MNDKQVIHWAKFMRNAEQGRYDATPATNNITPATDEAIEGEFYGDDQPQDDDLPMWLIEAQDSHPGACLFCKNECISPAAQGHYATGSYRKDTGYGLNRPQPFRGHVCDMHKDNIDWVSFKWTGELK